MMIVCICNNLSDKDIKALVNTAGVGNIRDLKKHVSVGNQCGTCVKMTQQIIDQTIIDESLFKEVV